MLMFEYGKSGDCWEVWRQLERRGKKRRRRILKLAKYKLKVQVEKDEGPSGEGQSPRVEKDEGPNGEG